VHNDAFLKALMANLNYNWNEIFNFGPTFDISRKLTCNDFGDYKSIVVKKLLYLYSMEGFVYKMLNIATRE